MTKLTPEQWSRLEGLFGDAIDQPAGARARFVTQSAGDDPAVQAELQALVTAFEEVPDDFLEAPVALTFRTPEPTP